MALGFRGLGFRVCETFRAPHHARRVVWCAPRFTEPPNPPTQFMTLERLRNRGLELKLKLRALKLRFETQNDGLGLKMLRTVLTN